MTTQQYDAYKAAGEAHVGANQIPALYEGCVKFMYQAKDAIAEKNYELRFNMVNRVSSIIVGLRECLDFEKAPDVAKALDDYYAMIDFQLLTLQSNDSAELCDQVIDSLKQMHGAWRDVASEHNKNADVTADSDVTLSKSAQSSMSEEAAKPVATASHSEMDALAEANNALLATQEVSEDVEQAIMASKAAEQQTPVVQQQAPPSTTYSSRGHYAGGYAQSHASSSMQDELSGDDAYLKKSSHSLAEGQGGDLEA